MHAQKFFLKRNRQTLKAVIFSSFLLFAFIINLIIIYESSGPVILGTELNTNGLIEYLCLGTGCENVHQMY